MKIAKRKFANGGCNTNPYVDLKEKKIRIKFLEI